jgi:hypothetical protein
MAAADQAFRSLTDLTMRLHVAPSKSCSDNIPLISST